MIVQYVLNAKFGNAAWLFPEFPHKEITSTVLC